MKKPSLEYGDQIITLFDLQTPIKTITFQVTEDCCLKCTYCYQINKTKHKMDFNTAKVFIDYLFEHRLDSNFEFSEINAGGLIIEFIGGEPLMEIQLIHQIMDYFEECLTKVPESSWNLYHVYSLSTNGVYYFDKEFQEIIEEYGYLMSIGVTIDGSKKLHDSCRVFENGSGSYDIAIKSALDVGNKLYDYSTKITVSPFNVQYVFEGVTDLISKGFSEININCVFEEGWNLSHAQILYQELKKIADWMYNEHNYDDVYVALLDNSRYNNKMIDKNWCGCSGHMMSIDHSGNIYPCLRFSPSSLGSDQEAYVIGNVYNGLFVNDAEKIRKKELNTLKEGIVTLNAEEKCKNCSIASGCAWCSAYNYQYYGTFEKRTTFNCLMHKAGALGALYCALKNNDFESYKINTINKKDALEIITEEEWEKLQWKGEE